MFKRSFRPQSRHHVGIRPVQYMASWSQLRLRCWAADSLLQQDTTDITSARKRQLPTESGPSPKERTMNATWIHRSLRRIRDARPSCMILKSALARSQPHYVVQEATGACHPAVLSRTMVRDPQMQDIIESSISHDGRVRTETETRVSC